MSHEAALEQDSASEVDEENQEAKTVTKQAKKKIACSKRLSALYSCKGYSNSTFKYSSNYQRQPLRPLQERFRAKWHTDAEKEILDIYDRNRDYDWRMELWENERDFPNISDDFRTAVDGDIQFWTDEEGRRVRAENIKG